MSDIADVISKIFAVSDGLTDPNPKAVARAASAVTAAFTQDQRDAAAEAFVLRTLTDFVRANVAQIERRSSMPKLAPPPMARTARREPSHGTSYWAYDRWCNCESCQSTRDIDAAAGRRLNEKIGSIVDEFKVSLRMQWTEELLASGFALGDGTTVTWGEATATQHQQRIDMLARNAKGSLETAARHQAAIDEIRGAGVERLSDVAAAGVDGNGSVGGRWDA